MSADPPELRLGAGLRIAPALFLAPMEGVTDPSFRRLVMEAGGPGALGAACTEFLRVTQQPLRARRIAAELGADPGPVPVGVQLMGNDPPLVAASAVAAAEAGAPFVDLNFGCPAPRVLQHCAGSALLDDPPLLERLVAETVAACPVPVTVKIRAGGSEDAGLEEIARRVEQAGAAALTVHARLRVERYSDPADWSRIRRAVAAVAIPVIGNGSADTATQIDAMFAATGCAGVMVGRGALGNPWVFRDWAERRAGRAPRHRGTAEVLAWLCAYAESMAAGRATPLQVSGRLKQSAKAMQGAGLLPSMECLRAALRENTPAGVLAALAPETQQRAAPAGGEPAV